jgi:hypothetical protein
MHTRCEIVPSIAEGDNGSEFIDALVPICSLFRSNSAETELAREVMRYRLLLAGGSSVAALGGLDAIVFSGPFADIGDQLGPDLAARLTFPVSGRTGSPAVFCFGESLDRLVADQAVLAQDGRRRRRNVHPITTSRSVRERCEQKSADAGPRRCPGCDA